MTRWLKEPLLHFLLAGAAIFALYAALQPRAPGEDRDATPVIDVSAAQVQAIAELWRRQWQRSPTDAELRAAVEQYVQEVVLAREAVEIGLDRDDSIVRRRLAQKMEFLSQDLSALEQPADEALNAYFQSNIGKYVEPGRLTFSHVYFSAQRRPGRADTDAKAALVALLQRPDSHAELGDSFMLEHVFANVAPDDIAGMFGATFADAVAGLPVGEWRGPIASGYGLHLVRITQRSEARRPALGEVRERVLADYQLDRRNEINRAMLARWREQYRITIDEAAIARLAMPAMASIESAEVAP